MEALYKNNTMQNIYRKLKPIILSFSDRLSDDFIVFNDNGIIKVKYTTVSWHYNSDWNMMAWDVKIFNVNEFSF